jgi:hypothetical protein
MIEYRALCSMMILPGGGRFSFFKPDGERFVVADERVFTRRGSARRM